MATEQSNLSRAELLRYRENHSFDEMCRMACYADYIFKEEKKTSHNDEKENEEKIENQPEQTKPAQNETDHLKSDEHYLFTIPVYAKTETPEAAPLPMREPDPISIDEIRANRETSYRLPHPSLVPWARLGKHLRKRLGQTHPTAQIDLERLTHLITRQKPLTVLPRKEQISWASHALIIMDTSDEMLPFYQDFLQLKRSLKRSRSLEGIKIWEGRGFPSRAKFLNLNYTVPILVMSAMGLLTENTEITTAWENLGRFLKQKGHPLTALLPVPHFNWTPAIAHSWECACWDRHTSLNRNRPCGHPSRNADALVDKLLALLAPCQMIEPGLLRFVRLLLGREASVLTEFHAWYHFDMEPGLQATGFKTGKTVDYLTARDQLFPEQDKLVEEVNAVIQQFHETYSKVYLAETLLRIKNNDSTADKVFERVVDRLRLIAKQPGGEEGRILGLPEWIFKAIEEMSPQSRNKENVSAAFALAVHYLGIEKIHWPVAINAQTVDEELKRLKKAPSIVSNWLITTSQSGIFLSTGTAVTSGCSPLALLKSLRTECKVTEFKASFSEKPATEPMSVTQPLTDEKLFLSDNFSQLTLSTDLQSLAFSKLEIPSWARRMAYDRFGLYVDLEVKGVWFRLRWIPPGRFVMGSPENENGRFDREVQHEVTISTGYWLAETQTTQALWEAVMGKNPSEHKEKECPVEQVSWEACHDFCAMLEKELADQETRELRLSFGLPTEAQWEYACRAGTISAFNDGSDCTVPDGRDPALEKLGWYDENSGRNTYPVKQKLPNAWGLYDMHGNVREWCQDWYADYIVEDQVDPKGPSIGQGRVLRGGGFWYGAGSCRSAYRSRNAPSDRSDGVGFRLAVGQLLVSSSKKKRTAAERYEADGERGTSDKGGKVTRSAHEKFLGLWDESASVSWPWDSEGYPEDNPVWAERTWRDEFGLLAEFKIKGVSFVLRQILPGSFQMGSPENEKGRYSDEGPQHKVTLTKGYWLATTPMTQAQWKALTGESPSKHKGENLPVEWVSWEVCQAFCKKLNTQIAELGAYLPTEAEWEYACRAGTTSAYNDGSDCTAPEGKDPALEELGWYDENSGGQTHPVCKKHPNAWGLYDMHGNVYEWCHDWHASYSTEAQVDPKGPNVGRSRVLRGGSYWFYARFCRSASRDHYGPSNRDSGVGFRLAVGQFTVSLRKKEEIAAKRYVADGERGTSD